MEKEFKSTAKEVYTAPDIEIVDIETEQNILAGGSSGNDLDMPGEAW